MYSIYDYKLFYFYIEQIYHDELVIYQYFCIFMFCLIYNYKLINCILSI